MKERLAYGGVFSFLIVILNDFSVLIYDVLSSFRLYNIQFKKVKILWGPGAEGRIWEPGVRDRVTQRPVLETSCAYYNILI